MSTRREYLAALDRLEGQVAREFLEAVRVAIQRATLAEIEAAIAAQNVDLIMMTVALNSAALSMTTEAVRNAYIAGGAMEAPTVRILFDIRNPRAEAWLAEQSSQFVTRIGNEQRLAIRAALESSMELGRGPRQTALDIVGRVGANGRRAGGIVGLTGPQSEYVASARRELLNLDRHYFTRTRRDKRFDSMVARAIRDGKPLSAADVDRIVGRYSDRLLQTRGTNIARTESIEALNAGRAQALQQAIDQGDVQQRFVTRTWDATGDSRTRPAHAAMNGQKRKAGQPFQSPTGALMMHPGDTSLNAGPEEIINCRCYQKITIDHIGAAAARLSNG